MTKKASNPFGLEARPLKSIRESLEHGWFDEASDTYEAHVGADAPAFAELVLWQASRGRPDLSWLDHLPPTTTPVQHRAILGRLQFDDGERAASGFCGPFSTMMEALHDALATDAGAVREMVAARGDWPVWMAAALAFAEWLRGATLSSEHARTIALRIARDQVRSVFGKETLPGREGTLTAREVGEALVAPDVWAELLRAANRVDGKHQLGLMVEAFAAGDWQELVSDLRSFDHRPALADEQAFVDVLLGRNDPDGALLALGDQLREWRRDSTLAELAELVVVNRRLDRCEPVNDLAERIRFVSTIPFALDGTRRLLAALTEDERRAVMKADRDRPGDALSIVALADDFDDEILDAYLERGSLAGEVVGRLGARVVSALEARVTAATHPSHRIKLSIALFLALAVAVEHGHVLSPAQLVFVGAYPASHPRFATLLAALPPDARGAMWRAAATSNAKLFELIALLRQHPPAAEVLADIVPILVERYPDADWDRMPAAITGAMRGEPVKTAKVSPATKLLEACASATGKTTQIYAFELWGERPPEGSLTRLGGKPGRGTTERHLFTIDLHDAPQLAAHYPGARALALFVPRSPGDALSAYHSTRLEALDAVAASALAQPDDASAFRLVSIHVPEVVFTDPASPLRQLLVNVPGYALGDAITIQEDPFIGGGFIMQLDDSFGINLGDAGRLYVYRYGATADCA